MRREDIPFGRECAITRAELAALWGVTERDVRRIIARMRREEASDAILSSTRRPAGFWRSVDAGEIGDFIREMESRARNTFGVLEGARRVLRVSEEERTYPHLLCGGGDFDG